MSGVTTSPEMGSLELKEQEEEVASCEPRLVVKGHSHIAVKPYNIYKVVVAVLE